jgi:surface protein
VNDSNVRSYGFSVRCFANQVQEAPDAEGFRPFVTKWQLPSDKAITIPLYDATTYYDFEIDRGDGTRGVVKGVQSSTGHTYTSLTSGEVVTVKIRGTFPRLYCNNNAVCKQLRSVDQWGDLARANMANAFRGTSGLVIAASDTPNLVNVTDMTNMFYGAKNLTGNFSGWDTSHVLLMSSVFDSAVGFNQDVSSWNVGKVTNMANMFRGPNNFNQSLS